MDNFNANEAIVNLLTGNSPWSGIAIKKKIITSIQQDLIVIGNNLGRVNAHELALGTNFWQDLTLFWQSNFRKPINSYRRLGNFLEAWAKKSRDRDLYRLAAYFYQVSDRQVPKEIFLKAFDTNKKEVKFFNLSISRQLSWWEKALDFCQSFLREILEFIVRFIEIIINAQIFLALLLGLVTLIYILVNKSFPFAILGVGILLTIFLIQLGVIIKSKLAKDEARTWSKLLAILLSLILIGVSLAAYQNSEQQKAQIKVLTQQITLIGWDGATSNKNKFDRQKAIQKLPTTIQTLEKIIEEVAQKFSKPQEEIKKILINTLFKTKISDFSQPSKLNEVQKNILVEQIRKYQQQAKKNHPQIFEDGIIEENGETQKVLIEDMQKELNKANAG
jgi:hypothetical protein